MKASLSNYPSHFRQISGEVLAAVRFHPLLDVRSIFFIAGLVPSAWVWLYAVSVMITRIVAPSQRSITFLRGSLDIENQPFRAVGTIAAALTLVIGWVIILVLQV